MGTQGFTQSPWAIKGAGLARATIFAKEPGLDPALPGHRAGSQHFGPAVLIRSPTEDLGKTELQLISGEMLSLANSAKRVDRRRTLPPKHNLNHSCWVHHVISRMHELCQCKSSLIHLLLRSTGNVQYRANDVRKERCEARWGVQQ